LLDLAFIAGGMVMLVAGARFLVDGAAQFARLIGVSEAVIGLTMVAAGTSLPEMATSVVAALRRQPDIAIGNVVGSNLFNLLSIMGLSSLVRPLAAPGIQDYDLAAMLIFAVVLLVLMRAGLLLQRWKGLLLVALYIGYAWGLLYR
jgi:cation:H+ antiporter